jgi:ABC-type sugar transport system ATPase subunit
VLGVAGQAGSVEELGAALSGLDRRARGDLLGGMIGLLPEDRKRRFDDADERAQNSTLPALGRFHTFGFIRSARERGAVAPLLARLALKCTSVDAPVKSLSGGNQQKALLARWLLVDPDVLFLDDPARGIDVGAKQDIYRIIDELAARGKRCPGQLELPELLRCSDRIIVLNEGRLTARSTPATPRKHHGRRRRSAPVTSTRRRGAFATRPRPPAQPGGAHRHSPAGHPGQPPRRRLPHLPASRQPHRHPAADLADRHHLASR